MRLLNVLKTLTWNSLLWRSRRPRLRRRPAGFAPYRGLAAEVLEHRQLLSATVNLTTSANGAIQLTSNTVHAENIGVSVTQQGGTIAFQVWGGTLHDTNTNTDFSSGTTFDLSLASVSSLHVNLGAGEDSFNIYDLNTTGNITFTGVGGGTQTADGWNIGISNDANSAGNTTIGGSIVANLGTATINSSYFTVSIGGSHNLTVNGSISVSDATTASFPQQLMNTLVDSFPGSLTIGGDVSFSSSGSGVQYNQVNTRTDPAASFGNVTINGNVTFSSSGTGHQSNVLNTGIPTAGLGGSVTVRRNVTIDDFGTSSQFNALLTGAGGANLNVGGSVTINSHGATASTTNELFSSDGNLTVGTVSLIDNSAGSSYQTNLVETNGAGNITTGSITISSAGGSGQSNFLQTNGAGNITVNGSVAMTASSGTSAVNSVIVTNDISVLNGKVTVHGNVAFASSGTGTEFNNISVAPGAQLLITGNLAMTAAGDGLHDSEIFLLGVPGDMTAAMTVLGSIQITDSGAGQHFAGIQDQLGGNLTVNGPVIVHDSGNGTHSFTLANEGGGGNMTVGGVTIMDSGSATHDDEIFTSNKGGALTVNGSVSVVDSGSGANTLFISAGYSHFSKANPASGGGAIQIKGSVLYDNHLNTTHGATVGIGGDLGLGSPESIAGSLTLNLANSPAQGDNVKLGLLSYPLAGVTETGKSLVIGGALNIKSGAGSDQIDLWALQVKGVLTVNTGAGTGDSVDIEGSKFDAVARAGQRPLVNTITMSGPYAGLFIADSHGKGWDPTTFASALVADMPGASYPVTGETDFIQLDGSGDGVTFNQQLHVIGGTPTSQANAVSGALRVDGPVVFKLNGVTQAGPMLSHWVMA